MSTPFVVGVDMGGTKIRASLVDQAGTVVGNHTIPTPARDGGDRIADAIANLCRRLTAIHQIDAVAVGVGTAGVVDPERGVVVTTSDTFAGLAGYPLAAELESRTGLPSQVDNDVHCFLRGEVTWGHHAGLTSGLAVMIGTGVGGAIMVNGHLLTGDRNAAGEIGHMPGFGLEECSCGARGHLESVAGGRAIGRRFAVRTGAARPLAARQVAARADQGDGAARAVLAEAGQALGVAFCQTATLLDLADVLVGGGITGAWRWLNVGVSAAVAEHTLVSGAVLRVTRVSDSSTTVARGAAALAWPAGTRAKPESRERSGVQG